MEQYQCCIDVENSCMHIYPLYYFLIQVLEVASLLEICEPFQSHFDMSIEYPD